MPALQTSSPVPTQPGEAARIRLLEGLISQHVILYESATLEDFFHYASVVQKDHAMRSRMWRLPEHLSLLINCIEDEVKAMDVSINTYSLPIGGSSRAIILVFHR